MNYRHITNTKRWYNNKKAVLYFFEDLQYQVIFSEEQLFKYLNDTENEKLSIFIENDSDYLEWMNENHS